MMQEPEAFSKAPSASPNRSENPSAGASAKYLGKREEELMKKRRRQTGKWTATSRRSCLRWLTSRGQPRERGRDKGPFLVDDIRGGGVAYG